MDDTVVTKDIAIKAALSGACHVPKIGMNVSEMKTSHLIWAEDAELLSRADIKLITGYDLPLWVLSRKSTGYGSGSGYGYGYGYGSGDGSGYGDGDGDGYGYGYGYGYGDGSGDGYGYGSGDGSGYGDGDGDGYGYGYGDGDGTITEALELLEKKQ